MSDNKRYYWLKLNENFFEREEIKVIENMPNGKDYIIFYMKLLLKSVSREGKLIFRDVIPYTPEMLSSITNTDVDTVRVATDLFAKLGLMEIWDDGTLFMVEVQNMVGSETGWAKKKRIQREKQDNVPLNKDNVPELSRECPTEIDIDIEKDIDIDIEKDIEKDMYILSESEKQFLEVLEQIKNYPLDREKDLEMYKTLGERYPELDLLEAVEDWRQYKLDKPLKENSNARSQINTSFRNYVKWGKCLKKGDNNGANTRGNEGKNKEDGITAERAGVISL